MNAAVQACASATACEATLICNSASTTWLARGFLPPAHRAAKLPEFRALITPATTAESTSKQKTPKGRQDDRGAKVTVGPSAVEVLDEKMTPKQDACRQCQRD